MKFKKVLIGTICAVLLTSTCVTASAVEKISTRDFYMNGYKIYGTLTLYDTYSQGYTFCENTTAGKSAYTVYAYNTIIGSKLYKSGGSQDYTYNNQTSVSAITSPVVSDVFESYAGTMTFSKVCYKQSYYHWESEGTDTELRMGYYKRQ